MVPGMGRVCVMNSDIPLGMLPEPGNILGIFLEKIDITYFKLYFRSAHH